MAKVTGHVSDQCVSWRKLNLIPSNQHLHQSQDFTKIINVFHSENSALFTVPGIRKSIKNQNPRLQKVTEDSRLYKTQTVQKAEKSS